MTAPAASPSLAAVLALVLEYRNCAYSHGFANGKYADATKDDGYAAKEVEARAALDAELRRLCESESTLRERIRLLDNVIVEHHASDEMRDGVYRCPVCAKRPTLFYENAALLATHHEPEPAHHDR